MKLTTIDSFVIILGFLLWSTTAFVVPQKCSESRNNFFVVKNERRKDNSVELEEKEIPSTISYEETDASSKGLVSSMTGLVNFFSSFNNNNNRRDNNSDNNKPEDNKSAAAVAQQVDNLPPQTPNELLERIRGDYEDRNYLWTGDIDLAAFDRNCRFTDPTLSFEGTDQFVENLNNLVPIVDALTEPGSCKSDLIQIDLNEDQGYVQSRWNMVGSLTGLPWAPMIDVVGRTKFWYRRTTENDGYQVYFYDEEWEIPAAKALLQLITPPGTIKNTSQ